MTCLCEGAAIAFLLCAVEISAQTDKLGAANKLIVRALNALADVSSRNGKASCRNPDCARMQKGVKDVIRRQILAPDYSRAVPAHRGDHDEAFPGTL